MTCNSLRRPAALPALALVLLALPACEDLPTGADAFQLEADGELWTAVVPPADLPTAATWLRFADPAAPHVGAVAAEVEGLYARAARARALGELTEADALLSEAAASAVGVMQTVPRPGIFLAGVASLGGWERSVRSGVDLTRAPALAAAVTAVERDREAVELALREGDPRAAALHLTLASERVRAWGPQGVALRVLGRVEAHLASAARSPAEAERAAHLVQSAREELLNGEPLRAVQRALYALQLAGGNELREIPAEEHPACGEYAC